MKFYKMHGCGNDYIYFDCMRAPLKNPEKLAVLLSDRHFYIGGDGVILLCPSTVADVKMRMFNSDGSEGKMCGNGIRCVGKLARDLGYVKGDTCTVETLSGVKSLRFEFDTRQKVCAATVNMGKAELAGEKIPSLFKGEKVVDAPLSVLGESYKVTLVSMGNPHCVTFVKSTNISDFPTLGRAFETHPAFPERVNTEFVKVYSPREIEMRVWERGTGETLACGTGACASVVAACLNGYCKEGEEITVHLRGGDLKIVYSGGVVTMTGGATLAYTGEIELPVID